MLTLRDYQTDAIDALYHHLRTRQNNPVCVIPTGGGKTPIMASLCKDAVTKWQGRVLIVTHVKELIEQSVKKLQEICPEVPFGIYSAGLKRRETDQPVIVAGIQSIYRKACELGLFNLILVDEAQLIAPDGEGMYRQFLAEAKVVNPGVRVIGLTATPYRLKSGMICIPDHFLNEICYEISVKELIAQGFLAPLITKAGLASFDTDGLHIQGGEFVQSEVEGLMDQDDLVEAACCEIVACTQERKSILIFAAGIKHGQHVQQILKDFHSLNCGFVSGETPMRERERLIDAFQRRELRCLINVNVLSVGFDAPGTDCVVLLRPTMSPGLFYQQVGRGFRPHPDKTNCLVLDFGGNVLRHGPVDAIRIKDKTTGEGPPRPRSVQNARQ